jgi:hypothetical protein
MLALVIGCDIPSLRFDLGDFSSFLHPIWPFERNISWPTVPVIREHTVDGIAGILRVLKFSPKCRSLEIGADRPHSRKSPRPWRALNRAVPPRGAVGPARVKI